MTEEIINTEKYIKLSDVPQVDKLLSEIRTLSMIVSTEVDNTERIINKTVNDVSESTKERADHITTVEDYNFVSYITARAFYEGKRDSYSFVKHFLNQVLEELDTLIKFEKEGE